MVSAIEKSQAGRRLEKRGEGNRKEMDGDRWGRDREMEK